MFARRRSISFRFLDPRDSRPPFPDIRMLSNGGVLDFDFERQRIFFAGARDLHSVYVNGTGIKTVVSGLVIIHKILLLDSITCVYAL